MFWKMAPWDTATYRKANQDALCFFDLLGEVREVIYQECFHLQNGLTIHLVDITDETNQSFIWMEARISSKDHTYLLPREGGESPDVSVLILQGHTKAAERMGLLRVCKAIHAEVDARIDDMNHFNVLASSELHRQEGYHGLLDAIPIQFLSNIKRLNLSKAILDLPETWQHGGKS